MKVASNQDGHAATEQGGIGVLHGDRVSLPVRLGTAAAGGSAWLALAVPALAHSGEYGILADYTPYLVFR